MHLIEDKLKELLSKYNRYKTAHRILKYSSNGETTDDMKWIWEILINYRYRYQDLFELQYDIESGNIESQSELIERCDIFDDVRISVI